MKNKKLILLPILLLTLTATPISGQVQPTQGTQIEVRQLDKRAKILSKYFASYGSPLQYHAQDFVDAADQYGMDWKLVPSIAGVESTFGKQSYGFNGWGWGIYGNQALGFKSWKEGIYTVTGGLKTGYIDKGLTNPYSMNKKYAASSSWGWKVMYFMKDLESFASRYDSRQAQTVSNPFTKTAGASAWLAYNVN